MNGSVRIEDIKKINRRYTRKSKEPDLNKRSGQVFIHDSAGLKAKQTAKEMNTTITNVMRLRQTMNYKLCEEKYANKILNKVKLDSIADEHVKIIKQDKDYGAKLNGIKFAVERIEPDNTPKDNQIVNIVFKEEKKEEDAK